MTWEEVKMCFCMLTCSLAFLWFTLRNICLTILIQGEDRDTWSRPKRNLNPRNEPTGPGHWNKASRATHGPMGEKKKLLLSSATEIWGGSLLHHYYGLWKFGGMWKVETGSSLEHILFRELGNSFKGHGTNSCYLTGIPNMEYKEQNSASYKVSSMKN